MTYQSENPDLTEPDPGVRAGSTGVLKTTCEKKGEPLDAFASMQRVQSSSAFRHPPSSWMSTHSHMQMHVEAHPARPGFGQGALVHTSVHSAFARNPMS